MALSGALSDAILSINGQLITDHNRSELSITTDRIETRNRMANGTLRVNHIANKTRLATSWDMVPSNDSRTVDGNRGAQYLRALYDQLCGKPVTVIVTSKSLGSEGTAKSITAVSSAGNSLKSIASTSHGFVVGDIIKITGFTGTNAPLNEIVVVTAKDTNNFTYESYVVYPTSYSTGQSPVAKKLTESNSVTKRMVFATFETSVVKRSSGGFDLVNMSVELEEV
jgi:hypothetical protein